MDNITVDVSFKSLKVKDHYIWKLIAAEQYSEDIVQTMSEYFNDLKEIELVTNYSSDNPNYHTFNISSENCTHCFPKKFDRTTIICVSYLIDILKIT